MFIFLFGRWEDRLGEGKTFSLESRAPYNDLDDKFKDSDSDDIN